LTDSAAFSNVSYQNQALQEPYQTSVSDLVQ